LASWQYKFGRNFEYTCQNKLRGLGFYVVRSYGSKGVFDLVAVPPKVPVNDYPAGTLLIQCKTSKNPKKAGYVRPEELSRLKASTKWLGTPIIMYKLNGRITWRKP